MKQTKSTLSAILSAYSKQVSELLGRRRDGDGMKLKHIVSEHIHAVFQPWERDREAMQGASMDQ